MADQICLNLSDKEHVYQVVLVVLVALDYWFGKTDRVKAGSLLEFIFPALISKQNQPASKETDNGNQ